MPTSTLSNSLRAALGLAVAPPLATFFAIGAAASSRPLIDAPLTDIARPSIMAGYFIGVAVFLPVYLFLRRYADMTCPARLTLLGAYSAWTAPVAYMLLLTIWRGDFFNAFVLDASPLLLSPFNALPGGLGGLFFWLVAAAPAPLSPLRAFRLLAATRSASLFSNI